MEPAVHRRWLDYIEAYEYFHEPGQSRLDRESWLALDAELSVLDQQERTEGLDRASVRRLVALRKVLLRD